MPPIQDNLKQLCTYNLALKDFGPTTQKISRVENVVADTIIFHMHQTTKTIPVPEGRNFVQTSYFHKVGKKATAIVDISLVQRDQQKYTRSKNSKISAYMQGCRYGYSKQALENIEIIYFNIRIYTPKTLLWKELYWYHLYINHPEDGILANKIHQVCYWKGLVMQEQLSIKLCNILQYLNNFKR